MKQYNPVTEEVIKALQEAVGEKYVKTEADVLDVYKSDESLAPSFWRTPEVVVLPANTEEVAAVVKIANKYNVPVTPRSAGTSVSCGAVPAYHGIVLLMERMNRILEINEEGMYMVVEAGVRTIDIQNLAHSKGLMYAGDPCSSDSCLIGGNLATNAGGNKAVRYGTTRHQVYSIEAVLPNGKVANLGATLKKCSSAHHRLRRDPWHHYEGYAEVSSPVPVPPRRAGRIYGLGQGDGAGAQFGKSRLKSDVC